MGEASFILGPFQRLNTRLRLNAFRIPPQIEYVAAGVTLEDDMAACNDNANTP
jgi:hypothetical protein